MEKDEINAVKWQDTQSRQLRTKEREYLCQLHPSLCQDQVNWCLSVSPATDRARSAHGLIGTRITSLYGSHSWAHEGFPSPSLLREAG